MTAAAVTEAAVTTGAVAAAEMTGVKVVGEMTVVAADEMTGGVAEADTETDHRGEMTGVGITGGEGVVAGEMIEEGAEIMTAAAEGEGVTGNLNIYLYKHSQFDHRSSAICKQKIKKAKRSVVNE